MLSDFGNWDEDGIKAFNNTFQQKLSIPNDIMNAIKSGFLHFGTSTVNFIFGVLFLILIVMVWVMVGLNYLHWGIALIITISLGVLLWVGSMMYQRVLKDNIGIATLELDKKMGLYTEEFASNIFSTLTEAAEAYKKSRKSYRVEKVNVEELVE